MASDLLSAISARSPKTSISGLSLVICENLEQLDPRYELSVSLLRQATQTTPTRYIGVSASLNDSSDLATWLDADPRATHSFRPSDRDQSIQSHLQTFSVPHSAALLKAMSRPAYAAVRASGSRGSAVIFVASRGQCRIAAQELLTQCALDAETERGFLPETIMFNLMEDRLIKLHDRSLYDFISRGVGFFHEGIPRSDRNLMLELFAEGLIRVLVVPHDSCWTLPVRAAVVVVMGTQYIDNQTQDSNRQLRDYSLTELVRMQGRAVRHDGSGHFHLFCQPEPKDTFTRFLSSGLPLESELHGSAELEAWYRSGRESGRIVDKQQAVDALSFTFLARRAVTNPSYYDADPSDSPGFFLSRIVDNLEECISTG